LASFQLLEGFASFIALKRTLGSSSFLFDSWWSEFPGYFIALCLSFQLLFLMLFFSVRMGCSFSYRWSKLPAYFIALWFSFHLVFLKLVFFFFLVLMGSSYVLQGCLFFSLHLRQHWILLESFWFSLQIIYIVRFVFHFCRVLLLYRQNKMQSFKNQYVSIQLRLYTAGFCRIDPWT